MLSCNPRMDTLGNCRIAAGSRGHQVHTLSFVDMAENGQNNREGANLEPTNLIINLLMVGSITQVWYQNAGNNFLLHTRQVLLNRHILKGR